MGTGTLHSFRRNISVREDWSNSRRTLNIVARITPVRTKPTSGYQNRTELGSRRTVLSVRHVAHR